MCFGFLFSSNLYFWCRGLESVPNKHTFTSLYLSPLFVPSRYISKAPRVKDWWTCGGKWGSCWCCARVSRAAKPERSTGIRLRAAWCSECRSKRWTLASCRLWCTKRTHITNRVPSAFFSTWSTRFCTWFNPTLSPKVRCTLALRTRKSFPHSCACICGSVSHGKRPHILTEVCCRL